MLPEHLHSMAVAVRTILDGCDRYVAANSGAHRACTSQWNRNRPPTKAQQIAGNYLMGDAQWHGLKLRIENPAHSAREGVDPDGKAWSSLMKAHYGYIAGTRGADGDGIDVFLGPLPESEVAWVINQRDHKGDFDEHKVLLGFPDERSAVDAYRLSYMAGWDRYGPPVRLSLAQLKWWLAYADHARELTPELVPPEQDDMNTTATPLLPRVFWDSAAMPMCRLTIDDVLYKIRVHDGAEGLLMDPLTMADILEGEELVKLDALVIQAGRLQPKMQALLRIMELAGNTVKPVAVQISEPVRRYGGVHVAALFEMDDGQTVTIWLHNPDSTPAKLTPADDLVSWKWVLNKKDITIVVAPESGTDLNTREAARRVMRLVEKNSPAFQRANVKRAERMGEIQDLKNEVAEKQAELAGLHRAIEVAMVEKADRQAANKPAPVDPAVVSMAAGALTPGYAEWEDALITLVEQRMEADRGDAQGIVEAKDMGDRGVLLRLHAEGLDAEAAYQRLFGDEAPAGGEEVTPPTDQPDEQKAAQTESDPEPEQQPSRAVQLQREAEGQPWGIGSPNFYGVIPDGHELPDDFMPTDNRQMAMDMGELAKEHGEAIAVQIKPDQEKPFRLLLVMYPDGRGVGSQWAATAAEAYAMVKDTPRIEQEQAPTESAEAKFLREVKEGAHDALALDDLLTKIEAAVLALQEAGQLTGDIDAMASAAITHWAEMEARDRPEGLG